MNDETSTTSALSNPIEPEVIPIVKQNALGTELTVSFAGEVTYPESRPSERERLQEPSVPIVNLLRSSQGEEDENA